MLKKSELSSFGLSPVFLFCSIFKKGMEQRAAIKREGETEIASFQKSLGIKNVTPGTVNVSVIRYREMAPSDPRRAVVSFARIVAGATGRNFVFYDSTRQQREKGIENGRYDPETGTTYIDINAGISETAGVLQEQVLPTISHELVHNFATEDPQGFARLSDLVFEGLKESTGKTRTALINAEIRRIKEATPGRLKGKSDNLQRSIASEEIVARACEDRLSNSRVMKEFIAEMDRKDSTLAQKFSNILGEAIAKVKKLFQSIISKVRSNSPEAKALAKLTDKLDAVQEQFDSLLERRGQTTAEAEQTKNTSERGVMSAERGSGKAKFNQYDSFENQIKYIVDPANKEKRIGQSLLVGRTPKVWKNIGLSDLPITMSVSHTRENYFPESKEHPDGKGMGKKLYQLPEKIQDPIAIFASETHPEDSIVALIELTDKNGKSVIIPIEINGVSKNSGYDIDVNRIKTAFGKKNALNLLRNALNSEMLGENTLFYWQKKKAISLAHSGGVQFPTTVPNLDGFIHSISENKNLVNTKVLQQTNTKQFKRWFGDWRNHPQKASKAVNEDGTPMILYHGTDEKFTEFDTERKRTRGNLNFGKGIYLTPKRNLAEMYSSTGNVMELYAAVKTPYEFFGARFGAEDLNELTEKFGEEVRIDNVNTILQKNGYDGIIARDYNGTTNPINQIVVFDASQLKSATENIGTFDKTNPDIRYSERHTYETARELLLQAAKETGKTDRSSPLALLVRVSLVFKKETSGKGRVSGISLIFSLFNIRSKRKGKPLALWRKGQDSYFLHKVSLVLSYQRKNRSLTDSP